MFVWLDRERQELGIVSAFPLVIIYCDGLVFMIFNGTDYKILILEFIVTT